MPQYETHSLASSSEKPVFIVGMIRSGTTLVEQIVSSHPDVGAGGELRFWYDDIQTAACEGNVADPSDRNLADEYLDLLNRLAPGKKRVTDKMPLNFTVLGTIRSWLPNARIIHCRRHPLDTGVSMYVTPYPYPVNFLHSRENIVYYYEQYLLLMEHWRRHLPSDRFFEVDYENLVTNQERAAREIIAFLGIGWRDECLRPNENARTIRTPSMWQVRQPIYRSSIGRWRNYEPWLGELMKLMPQ